jgi:hypothetical protein
MTNLQECIKLAQVEPRAPKEEAMTIGTYRAHAEVVVAASKICQTHGITLSSFLRKCMENLVRDYRDAQINQ